MSVLKLSKNDIIKNGVVGDNNKIKINKSQLSFDSAMISGWGVTNKSAYDAINNYYTRINNGEYLSADDLKDFRINLDKYIETSNKIRGINKSFGSGYSEEEETEWTNNITSLNTNYNNASDYYSTWKSEGEYKKYRDYTTAYNDFTESLKSDPNAGKSGWDKYIADEEAYRKAQLEKELSYDFNGDGEVKWWEYPLTWLSQIGQSADTTLPTHQITQATNDLRKYGTPLDTSNWSDEQKAFFGNVYASDQSKAYGIANTINEINKNTKLQDISNSATSSFGAGLGHSLSAIFASVTGSVDYLSDLVQMNATGELYESPSVSPFEYSQAVIGGVSSQLNSLGTLNIPIIGERGLGDVYSLGTSVLQSALTGAIGGGWGSLFLLGGSAAASGVDDALARGASNEQALGYGALVGLAEGVAEKIGIDNLFKMNSSAARNLFKNILKQAGAEALEEGLTSVINGFADNVIMGDKSNFNLLVNEYVSQGMSVSEAKKKAWKQYAQDIAFDMVGGAVSGGLHAAPVLGLKAHQQNKAAKALYKGGEQDLVAQGLEFDNGSEARTLAEKYQQKLNNGKSLSGKNLNYLHQAVEESFTNEDFSKIKSATEKRLAQLGETSNVSEVAEVIAKQLKGEALSKKEQSILNNSRYGQRVLNEITPENIESGAYSSDWTGSIGTERVHPELYSLAQEMAEETEADTTGVEKGIKIKNIPQWTEYLGNDETSATGGATPSYEGKTTITKDGETKEVSIKGIDAIKDGEVYVRLDDNEVVNAHEIDFSTKEEGLVYEMVANMNTDTANALVEGYALGKNSPNLRIARMPLEEYIKGFNEAYRYGSYGFPVSEMSQDGFSASLAEEQKKIAYNRGRIDSESRTKAKQANIEASQGEQPAQASTKKKGKLHLDKVTNKSLTERQKANIETLGFVADALGVDIHIFESMKGADGKRIGANGWFDPKDNSIHIDLHAGNNGESVMLFTASHELTHFIRKWSPSKFKVFADFLLEQYGKKGISVNELVQNQIDKARRNGREISWDTAYEEVIADSCEAMLTDSNAIEKLAKLKAKDKTLWDKIKTFISNLVAKIKSVYAGLNPNSVEANYVREMVDVAEQLQALWTDALVDAGESYSAISAEKTLAENGIVVNSDTNSASLMSVRDVLSDEQRDKVSTALASRFGVTKEEAMDWLKAETSMASLILNPKYSQYLDYTADPNEVAIKQNSDYPQGTVDFSPICAKRREFTSVMNNILRIFPNHVFAATDLAKIRNIMQEEGMTIPCGICYVEDRRQLDTIVAQNFIDSLKLYREGSKIRPDGQAFNANQLKGLKLIDGDSYTPTVYELVSLEGLNVLKEKNPNMAEAWVKFNNARGMQSVRLLANEAEYKRQILKYSKSTVKSKNDKGGLRVYSFSDAEMFHLIDIIQVITDSATVGLSLQGYTKVNEYAKTVKDTGEKLNRSLIPKGELGYHIENGKVILDYDTVEGIDINHPDFFDNKDNPNVGNITIGVSDVQIRAAMVSDFVDQIIPFHTGQSEEVLGEKGISTWSNYKDFQTEKDIATGKVSAHQVNIYTEVLQELEKEGKTITKRTFVEKYLQVCRENNLTPRFSQFLNTNENGEYVYTEGYHKMLVDFKTFAQTKVGEYLPQRPVKPIFDNQYITKILKDYVKSQKVKDVEISKSMPKVIGRITNEIVKPNDIKLSDRDSEGNTLTAEQQEFFKDSKVRDENGNLMVVYHGTNSHFTVFDAEYSDDKRSFFLTDSKNVAHSYTRSSEILNPYDYIDEDSSPQRIAEIAEKYVNGWKKVKVVSKERIDDVNSTVLGSIDTVIENAKAVKNIAKGTKLEKSFFIQALESSLQHLESWRKTSKTFANINPLQVFKQQGEVILNLSNRGELEVSEEFSSSLEALINKASEIEPLFNISKAYSEGRGTVFEVTNNLNDVSYVSDIKVRKEINWSQSTGLMPLYANLTNPLIVKANGRRWNNIKKLPEMDATYKEIVNTRIVSEFAHKKGYDGVIFKGLVDIGGYTTVKSQRSTVVVAFDSNQIKLTTNKTPTKDKDIRYSDRGYAPTFYSQMGKVVEGIKQEKFGASSVVPMLRGRGVKAEEIRWSGIVTFLEGKKSVTKQELLEFIQGSQLQVGEQMSDPETFEVIAEGKGYVVKDKSTGYVLATWKPGKSFGQDCWIDEDGNIAYNELDIAIQSEMEYGESSTRWSEYKLEGGSNYREIVFTLPNSTYSNRAMKGHWGEDAEGVLAHARIQDFNVNGKKMLFIEEIQSDWHNEGHSKGYSTKEYEDAVESHDKLYNEYKKLDLAFHKYVRSNEFMTDPEDVRKKKHDWLRGKAETAQKKYLDAEKVVNSLKEKGAGDTPDAPFKDTYHEYVLKRLLRMTAEEGYDSIGWTTADIQSKRWSEDYAEGYRIEYDQDIPKFLKKYGRQWGAKVDKRRIQTNSDSEISRLNEMYDDIDRDIDQYRDDLSDDNTEEYNDFIREGIEDLTNRRTEVYEKMMGTEIWSMDLTDSMKDSVLNEGQVLYQDRYSYETLTSKPDMKLIMLDESIPSNRADVVALAKKNATAIGKANKDGSVSVHVDDIGEDIVVTTSGLRHSLDRRFSVNAPVVVKAGEILHNSIRINELTPENQNADSSYVLIGAARNNAGELYIVQSVINRFKNSLISMDVLYAINAKTEPNLGIKKENQVGAYPQGSLSNDSFLTDSNISISQLLEYVNQYFPDVLSESVLRHYGHTARPEGRIGESALYSDRDPDSMSNRNLLANALESAVQNDIERNKLKLYKEKIDLINAEEKKLQDLNKQYKDLWFSKGKRDYALINEIEDERIMTANRINTYDKQLLNLEASKPLKDVLEREKKLAYKRAEQKGKEALAKQKEKDAATIREVMNRASESRKKGIENRHKTDLRHKIKKVVGELDSLLRHPTKEHNIKLGLQNAVIASIEAINLDTIDAEARIAEKEKELLKAKTPEKIAEIQHSIDFIRDQGESFKDKLNAMKEAYADIIRGEEGKNYPQYFKDNATIIEMRIMSVVNAVGNTPLRNMSLSQLEQVYDLYSMVLTTIRGINQIFVDGKTEELQENASAVMQEIEPLKKLPEERTKFSEAIKSFSWNEMTPYYAFDRIGSKTLMKFFWDTIRGQNVYAQDVSEAKDFSSKTREKYGYNKWKLDKTHDFKLKDGRTFTVTLKHMMSIYAYSKREQALDHMSEGGFFFNDKSTFRKKGGVFELIKSNEEGYKIDADILAEIKSAMTSDQINYIDEMQDYLTKMGEKGNEVTRIMWGIDIFKERYYFPLKSKDDFIKRSTETAQAVSLKNDGMTKETKPHASNPIVLEAFDDIWANHVERMSQYHAFVIPIDNLNKIHQYGTWAGTSAMSVSTMLSGRFGSAVNEYITQFIKDLNGSVVTQGARNPLMGFLSKFKKTAVGASLSTVVQQPTAILRAMAVINAKYFVGKPNLKTLGTKWAELKKYAPISIIKEIGGFDAGSGVQVSRWLNSDALRGADKVMDTIDDVAMKGAEIADQLGWVTIWEAVKREVKATSGLQEGSDAFLNKAGERFTEIIVKTQVYDSTLSRSGFMRSKNDLMKMLTSFMGEPTLSINMLFNAIINATRGGSKAQAVRAISFAYASMVAASAMASLIYALRDDDEDESYAEKYMQAFGGEFISDVVLAPVTSLPAIKDVVSIFQGWDIERTDTAVFKDLKDAIDGLFSENKSTYRQIEDFAGAIANFFGIPLKNVLRTGREISNAFDDIFDGIKGGRVGNAFLEGAIEQIPYADKLFDVERSKSEKLYDAIIDGDKARIEVYKKGYKDKSAYESALRKALRENDPRIREAAQAVIDGKGLERVRITREIKAEGKFEQDIIVGAINAEVTAIKKELKEQKQ